MNKDELVGYAALDDSVASTYAGRVLVCGAWDEAELDFVDF